MSSALSPEAREAALAAMAGAEGAGLDVLVVGGGVTGAGVALDAVTRGLSCGLLEQRDLASGTSSRSSKLVHGGLRYLELLHFGLVREALRERGLLLTRLAPHLVRPVPFVYPLTSHWERPYVGAGMLLYDAMAGAGAAAGRHPVGVPRHRHLTRRQALAVVPALRPDSLTGAVQYHDCQVDDARHTLSVARTASHHGAHVATRTRVTGFLRDGERVTGVHAHDLDTGRELTVTARVVVNAAGVWTDEIQEMAGRGALRVHASKGVHLLVPRDRIPSSSGIILRTAVSVLFVIPWGRHWIIGTTDTSWGLDKAHPSASRTDIDYLLDRVNQLLLEPLGHDDDVGVYAGLRPLLRGESEATSRISREHTVVSPVPGLVLVAGGKYTTYRVMAGDAVDAAAADLGGVVPASITDRVPLLGAEGFEARVNQKAALARTSGLSVSRIEHLLGRFGDLVDEVLALITEDPRLGLPIPGAEDYLSAEVVYAVTHEAARHLDDVLTRRTRISIETHDRGLAAARPAAQLMAPALGWDGARVEAEVDHYHQRVAAERDSQAHLTDEEAHEARIRAPDRP